MLLGMKDSVSFSQNGRSKPALWAASDHFIGDAISRVISVGMGAIDA